MKRTYYLFWRWFWYSLYVAGIIIILVFWWGASGQHTAATASSLNIAAGNITGLIGTYAILWQLVLLGRLTFLECHFGLEKLTWLHKWNGYLALTLILLHTLCLILGFAAAEHISLIKQTLDFMFSWEDVLKATLATVLLIVIVPMSIGIVRRGFKYETWYYVHLVTYLAILLAFSHQLSVGSDLAGNSAFQIYWYTLYTLSVGTLLLYRFMRPAYLVYKHRFQVDKVVPETGDVVSVYVRGQQLDQLAFQPGQFIIWRFLDKDRWWQAHPFSISVAPNGQYLRLTAKMLGDFTRSLATLQPGTWVSVDGPHGNFTGDRLSNPNVLLIAGGVGITPIRSLLERLPPQTQNVVLVYAARTQSDLALHTEIDNLAATRPGVHVKYLLSNEMVPGFATGVLDDANLRALVPDAATREVMLCGPPPMMNAVTQTLQRAGVPATAIHTERFAY
jgi:predicted ferric reductase